MDVERGLISRLATTGKGLDEIEAAGVRLDHFGDGDTAAVFAFIVEHTKKYGRRRRRRVGAIYTRHSWNRP